MDNVIIGGTDETVDKEPKASGTTPIKKPSIAASLASKQRASKQISIRGIPMVKLKQIKNLRFIFVFDS
jgi:hypothetical protein